MIAARLPYTVVKAVPKKDESITRLLEQLRRRLGVDAFDVVDHWKCDLRAIGVARPDNHSVLVCISTFGKPGSSIS
jgi:hypothetical protein